MKIQRIEYLASGLLVAVVEEADGGVNMASWTPDGTFHGTMFERDPEAAPIPPLTREQIAGATDISTGAPHPSRRAA